MIKLINRSQKFKIEGLPDIIASLLYARGIAGPKEAQSFLNPSVSDFNDPFLLNDMDAAVKIIKSAAKNASVPLYTATTTSTAYARA